MGASGILWMVGHGWTVGRWMFAGSYMVHLTTVTSIQQMNVQVDVKRLEQCRYWRLVWPRRYCWRERFGSPLSLKFETDEVWNRAHIEENWQGGRPHEAKLCNASPTRSGQQKYKFIRWKPCRNTKATWPSNVFFCDADADKVLLYDRCINISVHISVHVIFTGQTNANRIKTNNLNKKGSGKSAEVGPSTL
jgi:hypothetical protein